MLKINRKIVFLLILIQLLTSAYFIHVNPNLGFLRAVFSFTSLSTIPGLLIVLVLKIKNKSVWEYVAYAVGFSISFMLFFGVMVNELLPMAGVYDPLNLHWLSLTFYPAIALLFLLAYVRNKDFLYTINFGAVKAVDVAFSVIPVLFPALAVLGALSLNNDGSNVFTMILLSAISFFVICTAIYKDKISDGAFISSLFFISTSLLLMTSMRGWYTTGHDIQSEFYVFQLTKNSFHWDINVFKDAYNACLSLNILPTVLQSFTNVKDAYIFKVLFQILFSVTPVILFLFFRKFISKFFAFLATFYFMSFPTFYTDMPMLNRQEIAFIFFALLFLVLNSETIKPRYKDLLFLIFGFSMTVSHYSTSYIAIAIFIAAYILSLLPRLFIYKKSSFALYESFYLTLVMVLGVAGFTLLWNFKITATSSGFTGVLANSIQNLSKTFEPSLRSERTFLSVFKTKKMDKATLLDEYIKTEKTKYENVNKDFYYAPAKYENSNTPLVAEYVLPSTVIGRYIARDNGSLFNINFKLRSWGSKLVQLFAIIGVAVILFKKSPHTYKIHLEYKVLSVVCILLLGCFLVIPFFSIQYGVQRFFQQALIVLAVPTILGCVTAFNFLGEKIATYVTTALLLVFFTSLTGLIPQILGGYYPQLHLNNSGVYYDSDYTHTSEVASSNWLKNNLIPGFGVNTNDAMRFKIRAISGVGASGRLLPFSIRKDSYIYLDRTNVIQKINRAYYKNDSLYYSYPVEFLDENKNLIYSNSTERIYK